MSENATLLRNGDYILLCAYLGASLFLGFAAFAGGRYLANA